MAKTRVLLVEDYEPNIWVACADARFVEPVSRVNYGPDQYRWLRYLIKLQQLSTAGFGVGSLQPWAAIHHHALPIAP